MCSVLLGPARGAGVEYGTGSKTGNPDLHRQKGRHVGSGPGATLRQNGRQDAADPLGWTDLRQ
jgi:hypothetical protein